MENKELIDLCKQGDEQALGLLYTTYADKMMRICLRYVSDEQTAQDLLHDGFLIIFSSLQTLRSPEKLESWMGKIMKNIALQYLKESRPTSITLESITESEEPAESMFSTDIPTYEHLLKTIETLPQGYRNVFKLAVLENLSHKEIASLLGIAPHSSSSQLARAKEMLRKLLSRYAFVIGFALSFVVSLYLLLCPKKNEDVTERNQPEKEKDKSVKTIKVQKGNSLLSDIHLDSAGIEAHQDNDTLKNNVVMPDSIIAPKDSTINETPVPIMPLTIFPQKQYTPIFQPEKEKKSFSFSLAYTSEGKRISNRFYQTPGGITSGESQQVKEKTHHHFPVNVSLALRYHFNPTWGIETGLQYTYLRSDFTRITDLHNERIQKVHYIGISLKGIFNLWNRHRFSIYTSAGITLDIPVKAISEETIIEENHIISYKKTILKPSLQGSTQLGIGIQYQLTPSISIYAEPNLNYYFKNDLNTIRKEHPFTLTLPVGIRYSW